MSLATNTLKADWSDLEEYAALNEGACVLLF